MRSKKKKSLLKLLYQQAHWIWGAQRLIDALVATLTLFAITSINEDRINTAYLTLGCLTALLTPLALKSAGVYDASNIGKASRRFPQILLGWGLVATILLFIGFFTQNTLDFSRIIIFTWLILTPVLIAIAHQFVSYLLTKLQSSGQRRRKAVIGGTPHLSRLLAQQLYNSPELGVQLSGFFLDRATNPNESMTLRPALGELEQLPEYVRKHSIDVVYLVLSLQEEDRLSTILAALQDTTASVYFVPNITMFSLMKARTYEINGIPLISVWEVPFSEVQYFAKRLTDIAIALAALLLLSPIMLGTALAIRLTSPGPILFKQFRYGVNGQRIKVYKFRSMRVQENGSEVKQATKNDSRITPVGSFLRKTSLDELPQFFNVLQGRMSIVGPRPHAVAHNEYYRQRIQGYMLRHLVKPGITGWAQVNGLRGETETLDKMEARIEYDLQYLRQWSLWFDCLIILKTFSIVLKRENAY
ncbi:MAG: undecaprenyl-phosphate glucose phosphotransferase [Cyanobacteria bacterium P01_F01_bin.42]